MSFLGSSFDQFVYPCPCLILPVNVLKIKKILIKVTNKYFPLKKELNCMTALIMSH